MEALKDFFNKKHTGELILVVLMVLYLVMGFQTPKLVAGAVDNLAGKIIIILVVIYLFMYSHPILAVVAAFVAFDLMKRSAETNDPSGLGELQKYAPSEKKKLSQFTAFNQFPYTLEQEVVAKMAPLVHSGSSIHPASYKPVLENLYDASPISSTN